MSKPRVLRPRPPIVVSPLAVTTDNCLAIAGLTPRKFRELLDANPQVRRVRVGHTLLVQSAHLSALLDVLELDVRDAADPEGNDDAGDETREPTCDELLARIGRRRTA